jgi:hypothetical protein
LWGSKRLDIVIAGLFWMKNSKRFFCCIVIRFLGGMQNAWASCLVLSSSCFALVDLICRCVRSCSCGDLRHCCSCCCSRCGSFKLVSPVAVHVAFVGTY